MRFAQLTGPVLAGLVTLLAVADGAVHLTLDFVLFRGNLFGPLGPPPGTAPSGAPRPPQLPLPLNQVFVLNFVGYLILAALIWFGPRWLGARRWIVDVALASYVLAVFVAWLLFNRPNPMGLGLVSKAIEIALLVLVVVHFWISFGRPRAAGRLVQPAPSR